MPRLFNDMTVVFTFSTLVFCARKCYNILAVMMRPAWLFCSDTGSLTHIIFLQEPILYTMDMTLQPSQKQTITHQMIQASEILQMNNMELEVYLQNLALENPLLDFEEPSDDSTRKKEWLNALDEQNRVYEKQERQEASDPWNLNTAMTETLEDSLLLQVNTLNLPDKKIPILNYLIQSLESSGYLSTPLEEIAASCHCTLSEAEELLGLLQTLEPDGIGARTLSECLSIQLKKKAPDQELALLIVRDYLDLLGKNQIPAIARVLHRPQKAVMEACSLIRSLNPRPGSSFGDRHYMPYIRPELIVIRFDGYFDILLNDSSIPALRMNTYYLEMLENGRSEEATQYLKKKKKELEQIQENISQRSGILLSLGKLIVERQQDFFLNGPGHLHTLLQSDAASVLGVHESVISRAANDKYLQCQYGVFPFSYFFIQGRNDKDEVKNLIRDYIAGENKAHPYSDQKISDLLARDGLTVSKRLVTKYRTAMNIPAMSARRTYEPSSHT